MKGNTFRLRTPTLGIVAQDGQKTPVTIPQGALVTVTDGLLDGNSMIDVIWEGKAVMMFTTDLRERGESVSDATA